MRAGGLLRSASGSLVSLRRGAQQTGRTGVTGTVPREDDGVEGISMSSRAGGGSLRRRPARFPAMLGGLVVALTVLVGCGSDEQANVAWAGGLCASYLTFLDAAVVGPEPSADPAVQQERLSAYFDTTIESTTEALRKLDALGDSPISGGTEAVAQVRDQLTRYQAAFTQARDQVAAVDPGARDAAERLKTALGPVAALQNAPDEPFGGYSFDLVAAMEKAPSCQDLATKAQLSQQGAAR